MTPALWTGAGSLALSWALVGWARRYALRAAIIDFPNERSSHTVPTPRGGGAGLVAAMVLVIVGLAGFGRLPVPVLLSLLGTALVAFIGWRDDLSPLGVRTRLAAHTVAAVTLLPIVMVNGPLPPWMGWGAVAWWMFWAVSAVNVVNFMDGIDGLVGSQVFLFGLHLLVIGAPAGVAGTLGVVFLGSSAGFLVWNWAPARVFLGDIGSGTLGFMVVMAGAVLMRESKVSLLVATCRSIRYS